MSTETIPSAAPESAPAIPALFIIDRSDRGRLRLTGRDRQSFLQGMVTNDVARLAPGEGCYAFLLDATGHVLADARILCTEDSLLLDVEPGMAPFVAETLEKYLIMERVRIEDITDATDQKLIGGIGSPDLLARYGVADASSWTEGRNAAAEICGGQARAASTRLIPVPAFDIYLESAASGGALWAALSDAGAAILSEDSLEALRIEAGVPRFGVDIDSRVLAPETGQRARAISYRKGCYIGQEIVARIDARGHTNRALAGFVLERGADPPSPETLVEAGGREVGRITSVALSPTLGAPIALGYIRKESGQPGTPVVIGGQSATVSALPFGSGASDDPGAAR